MKIAMIGQKGIPGTFGGVERHVEELSKRLSHQGHDVFVFCRSWYTKPQEAYEGVRLVFTSSWKTKHLDAITHTFTSILQAARMHMDIFHLHGVGPALLAWLPKLLCPSAKVIVTFHCIDQHHEKWSLPARLMLRLGEKLACTIPDLTIVVSKELQQYCKKHYKKETLHIPNGTTIPCGQMAEKPLKPFGLTPEKYFLMCARLVKHKGAHLLIEAWREARRLHPGLTKDMKLAIVGGSAFTDAYVREIQALAKEDETIVLTGSQSGKTLESLYAHCYAMVHPSWSEGLPIAVLEGMSYGKCVLAANIPENQELIAIYGLQFENKNVTDLSEKIIALLEEPEQVQLLGKQARLHVAQNYDWDDIADTTHHFYEWLKMDQKHKPQFENIHEKTLA